MIKTVSPATIATAAEKKKKELLKTYENSLHEESLFLNQRFLSHSNVFSKCVRVYLIFEIACSKN